MPREAAKPPCDGEDQHDGSSVGVDLPAMPREAAKPPCDGEDQHDGVQGK